MTTYYVSQTGNDSNPGTGTGNNQAWLTINKATTTAVAGDTVNIMAGTYTENDSGAVLRTHNSGSNGSPITFQAYANDAVILRNRTYGILLANNYIVFNSIRVENNNQSAGMTRGCTASANVTNITLNNCTFKYMSGGGDPFGIDWQYVSNGHIKDCAVDYVGTSSTNGTEDGDGIGIAGVRNFIENTTTDHCGHSGLFLTGAAGGYHLVRNCNFSGTWGICAEYLCYGRTDIHVLVENSTMHGTRTLEDGLWTNYIWQQQGSGLIFRRNRLYDGSGPAITVYSNVNYHSKYARYYHNIFYDCGWGNKESPPVYNMQAIEFKEEGANTSNDNIFKNHIHFGNALNGCAYSGTANASQHTEVAVTWNGTDPKFTDAANKDFTLQATSPCIDAGAWLTTITSATGSGNNFTVADANYFCDGFDIPGVTGDEIQIQGQNGTVRITDVNYSTRLITVNNNVSWTQGNGIAAGLTA